MRIDIILSLTLIVLAFGNASQAADPGNSYDAAHAAAVAAIEHAADKRHAWTTSDQLLKDAAKAAAEGDEARAILLADEARIHAELAVIQADTEATAWRDNVTSE